MTIEYSPLTQTWRLPKEYGFHVGEPLTDTEIEAVNLIVRGDVPVQVFLEVTGHFDCSAVGEVGIRELDKAFTVYVFHHAYRGVFDCAYPRPLTAFRKVVPLDVYGLDAGTYTYTVNGSKFGGSFTLTADNALE